MGIATWHAAKTIGSMEGKTDNLVLNKGSLSPVILVSSLFQI